MAESLTERHGAGIQAPSAWTPTHRWKPLSIRVPTRNDRDEFLAVKHSANWYDFTVSAAGQDAFSRRFAGRLPLVTPCRCTCSCATAAEGQALG